MAEKNINPDSKHYQAVMQVIEGLMLQCAADPEQGIPEETGTPDVELLTCLADAIQKYESKYWPMGDDAAEK